MIELVPRPDIDTYCLLINGRRLVEVSIFVATPINKYDIIQWLYNTRYNRNRLQALILDKITPEEWAEILEEIK